MRVKSQDEIGLIGLMSSLLGTIKQSGRRNMHVQTFQVMWKKLSTIIMCIIE